MQLILSTVRKFARVLKTPLLLYTKRFIVSDFQIIQLLRIFSQWQNQRSLYGPVSIRSGITMRIQSLAMGNSQLTGHDMLCNMILRAFYASQANSLDSGPSDAATELYVKMLKSIEAETMPPISWHWSLIESCANREDIILLFQMLQKLQRFRLSKLRIHAGLNCSLCLRVAEACVSLGALDFGKKTLLEHNTYGLIPSVGSAHYLLLYAKEHNDADFMVEIMDLMRKNHLPLHAGTADIIFSICYNTDNWGLITNYSEKFIRAGVQLRRTTLDTWMEFAAKIGNAESIWRIEEIRSSLMKHRSLASGFSCAKGFLLEHKPERAAAIVQILNQNLSKRRRPGIMVELQKLVNEWPLEVIKRLEVNDKKAFSSTLKSDINAMITGLLDMGLEVTVTMEE